MRVIFTRIHGVPSYPVWVLPLVVAQYVSQALGAATLLMSLIAEYEALGCQAHSCATPPRHRCWQRRIACIPLVFRLRGSGCLASHRSRAYRDRCSSDDSTPG